ncbi:hypothetical protein RSSM_01019 [Rhodopirellula sallentina SM41]|uniref:Uncharacterized protein n=1 Tax=Rhodopirellula sallentina SM41 TaxID=1263870 RepID=M5U7V2_9BACT|nr:hypothetical protein RSSM_01019 [Rhodopirellula sallentina SM41]
MNAGFTRISARRYLRVTAGDVAQRIELRPNRHGGEFTCDLTIHPLWARNGVNFDVLEPGIWIKTVCEHFAGSTPTWYDRSNLGLQQLADSFCQHGLRWFDDNSDATGIVQSSTTFTDPWYNEQHTHVELGHCLLRAGRLADAQRTFDRKPKRVAQYKSISQWIADGNTARIAALHDDWIAVGRLQIDALT